MTLMERAIALFSPKWALERAAYRNLLRSYEAGEVNRFNDDWTPINEDTENADKTQRDLIKARARYLERNSDIANAAVGGIVRNVVGTGIKPQARTPSEDLNQEIEALWAEWAKPERCDITGQQSFYEMEAMLLRRQIFDGEIFVKKVFDPKSEIPLKLQVIKSDLLSQYLMYAPGTDHVIRSGVELDEFLRPLAYWIERKSPDGYITFDPDRIPADEIIHLWQRTQPDQIRGVSYLAPIVKRIKDTQDYLDAETVAAKVAACFSIFIKTNMGGPGNIGRASKRDGEGKLLKSVR
ncbi:MAG: phage portal protein, partial [Proteobacteria bacterium]|nr:phage portal protein [Pseudomonadota bacterium]